ncbi:MAG TPA: VOC family protein [Dehalococcoidia bacterium]|nr:VOC family protein [Dehalococcoidia bacterium]
MTLRLDHVVIAVRDLDTATADYSLLLGRTPSWRGEHPQYGTRNTLFRLENTYVELLALGGSGKRDARWAGELERFLGEHGEGVYALAIGVDEVDRYARDARKRGLQVLDPADGSGVDEITGGRRAWRNAQVPLKSTRGARLFFIQHHSPPEALPMASLASSNAEAGVERLDHVVVLSADLEASRQLWQEAVEARLALDRTFPDRNARILFFRLGDITIEISGGAVQAREGIGKPDRLWGLAWRVPSVEEACTRLRAAGIDVSGPRPGIKPGTRVATVKGEHAHGVATLLIEHTRESFAPESRLPHSGAFDAAPERRAFTAKALDHVVLSAADAEATAAKWREVLGMPPAETLHPVGAHMKLIRIPAGNAFIELAQPLSEDHRLARSIGERGQGMFSIAVEVDDLESAVADLRAKGVPVSDPEAGVWSGTRIARINKSATNGVSIQLIQRA